MGTSKNASHQKSFSYLREGRSIARTGSQSIARAGRDREGEGGRETGRDRPDEVTLARVAAAARPASVSPGSPG